MTFQASGRIGEHFAKALVATGQHSVTALTRRGSKSALPAGVKICPVDYDDAKSIVAALQDQQFLIITLSATAPPDMQSKIVQAAARAGVQRVMPNLFSLDETNAGLMAESPLSGYDPAVLREIETAGVSWTSMVCGMWYEYSLAMGPTWFGFDFARKVLTLYDDGTTRVNLTTWEQCGSAVAALLCFKALPDDANDTSLTVDTWSNKPLVISSFLVSQKAIFESWKRVSGDTDADWTVESESSRERYDKGMQAMTEARDPMSARMGAAKASFVRFLFQTAAETMTTRAGWTTRSSACQRKIWISAPPLQKPWWRMTMRTSNSPR